MHILFITHNFPPEVNAPASRTYEHCRRWVAKGHRVTVITTVPNWPQGVIYPGYKNRLIQRDEIDGIDVIRVFTYVTPNKGFSRRIFNYLIFMLFSFIASFFVRKPDLTIATSPQFFAGIGGWAVSCIKRTPFVLEIRDLWPESIIALGALKNRAIIAVLESIESWLYHRADQIVVVSKAYIPHIQKYCGEDAPIAYVPNGVDFERYSPQDAEDLRSQYIADKKLLVSYIGTLGMAHGLGVILQAALELPHVQFLIVGDGAKRSSLEKEQRRKNISNVTFTGLVEKEKISDYWNASDVCLIHLRKSPVFLTTIPSKMFEAMVHAKPIVLGVEGEAKAIFEESGAGVCITPESGDDLAKALQFFMDNPEQKSILGQKGRDFVKKYDRSYLANKMLSVLEGVVQKKPNLTTVVL